MILIEEQRAWELLGTFLVHNPYNIRAHISGLYDLVESYESSKDLTQRQKDNLYATLYWHIPPTMAHIGVRMGLIPAVTGGFGYFKPLTIFPMLGLALGYQQLGYTVSELPSRVISATGGTGGVYKPPGSHHFAFRNPISGM